MYKIEFNGMTNEQVGVLIRERPAIPAPEYRVTEQSIPGRDGSLYEIDGTVQDITITVAFTFACKPEEWQTRFRDARAWLLKRPGDRLCLDDDGGRYYRVKYVRVNQSERSVKEIGEFDAEFICDGYQYLMEGELALPPEQAAYNPYDLCHPTYLLDGSGNCTLTVNGTAFQVLVLGKTVVNTDLMLAYLAEDGASVNTAVTGDYTALYLHPGENTIHVTDGYELEIIPNWRCM